MRREASKSRVEGYLPIYRFLEFRKLATGRDCPFALRTPWENSNKLPPQPSLVPTE